MGASVRVYIGVHWSYGAEYCAVPWEGEEVYIGVHWSNGAWQGVGLRAMVGYGLVWGNVVSAFVLADMEQLGV